MMLTESMIRLFAIVSERDAEKVTEALLRLGVMEFISTGPLEDTTTAPLTESTNATREDLQQLRDARKRVENLLATAGVAADMPSDATLSTFTPVSLKEENSFLDTVNNNLRTFRERQRNIQNDILKYEEIHRQVRLYGASITPDLVRAHYSYVTISIGSVPAGRAEPLREHIEQSPAVVVPVGETDDREHLVLITMKRNQENVSQLLNKYEWVPMEHLSDLRSVKNDISSVIDEKLLNLRKEQTELQQKSRTVITDNQPRLLDVWARIRVDEMRIGVMRTFKHTSRTLLFTGWLPSGQRYETEKALTEATEGRCHLEWFSPDTSSDLNEKTPSTPVLLKNPPVLSPFQMLVTNFGVPEYGTIDPTPFVVITYLSMFGIMFADIGQGAVISLAGIIGVFSLKKNTALRKLAPLLIWCGGASMITGSLFGSFFGFSFHPLWFDFHGIVTGHAHPSSGISSIFDILGITVFFGIAVICCGLLFNWVNLIIKKRWVDLIFDKSGILGGWIYCGGIYTAHFMITHNYREVPATGKLLLTVLLPSMLLFIKAPLHAVQHGARITVMELLNFFMEWAVELLEVFSGYLSNTLSFMRVAGLGIAHVSLMVSFFTMADIVRGTSPTVLSSTLAIILLILGNALVIVLEGLSAGIQALRLNYYEFFTKFFTGTGRLFKPVSLRKQSHQEEV